MKPEEIKKWYDILEKAPELAQNLLWIVIIIAISFFVLKWVGFEKFITWFEKKLPDRQQKRDTRYKFEKDHRVSTQKELKEIKKKLEEVLNYVNSMKFIHRLEAQKFDKLQTTLKSIDETNQKLCEAIERLAKVE